MRSFSAVLINSTCVSLSWTLMEDAALPVFMVVQWSLPRKQDWDQHSGSNRDTWVRLPYTDRPAYLQGSSSQLACVCEACVKRATVTPSLPLRSCLRFGGLRILPVPRVCGWGRGACVRHRWDPAPTCLQAPLCGIERCVFRSSQQRRSCHLHVADDHLFSLHRAVSQPDLLSKPVRTEPKSEEEGKKTHGS